MNQHETGAGKRDTGRVFLNLVTGACLFFCFALVANNIYPTRRCLSDMHERKSRLEREIEEHRTRTDFLNRTGDALESDPYLNDRYKRKVFRSPGENELLIRVQGEDE